MISEAKVIRRRRTRLILVLILVLMSTAMVTARARPASADTVPVISGASWMGGHGVNACSASTDPTCGGQTHVGGIASNWWQCVELAQRTYQVNGWYSGIFPGVSYAFDIYNQAAAGNLSHMVAHANGSGYTPVAGDLIVHNYNHAEAPDGKNAGHVAVVDYVDASGVHVVEENYAGTAHRATYSLSGTTLSRTLNNGYGQPLPILGVVHSSLNTLGSQSPPNPAVYQSSVGDFNGDGHVDVALRNMSTGTFYIRYGPAFTSQDTFQWDHSTNYQAFVGDFNGDGHADVALRDPGSGIFYIRYGPAFTSQDTFQWDHG